MSHELRSYSSSLVSLSREVIYILPFVLRLAGETSGTFCGVSPMVLQRSVPTIPVCRDCPIWRQLYQELQVPLDAMVYGLQALQTASKQELKQQGVTVDDDQLDPYFNHLIQALDQFQAST